MKPQLKPSFIATSFLVQYLPSTVLSNLQSNASGICTLSLFNAIIFAFVRQREYNMKNISDFSELVLNNFEKFTIHDSLKTISDTQKKINPGFYVLKK